MNKKIVVFHTITLCIFQIFKCSAFNVSIDNIINMKIYGSIECGTTDNRALYSTFGYERQLFTCTQAIIGINGSTNRENKSNIIFKFEFAPIYNSIKMVDKRSGGKIKMTAKDIEEYKKIGISIPADEIHKMTYKLMKSPATGKVIEIDGSSEYVNWYKNQGSRLYYIEDFPVKEMYIGWLPKNDKHLFSAGRMKNLLSFDESETIWQEDAWFAPMSYWISKDLYTGLKYTYNSNFGVNIDMALFSGDGNPTKNGIYYINNLGSTNKKSNNTPTFDINISYNFDLIGFENSIFFGFEKGVIGSVWDVAINEGKHNKDILATGIKLSRNFDNKIINNLKLYFQYTDFKSGLRNKNTQTGNPTFKNIKQNGFFAGTDLSFFNNIFKIGLTYEMFKRYDYYAHIYSVGNIIDKKFKENENCLEKYINSYQHSFIINTKFYINRNIYLNFAANFIKDPINWVSEVLPNKGSNRYKFTININF